MLRNLIVRGKVLEIKRIMLFFTFFLVINSQLLSQITPDKYVITHDDSLALENIIVEKYYVSDSNDYLDKSANALPKGSVTYRIFVDMKPGYNLQLVYGNQKHELFLETTTKFFNDLKADAITGFNVDTRKLNEGNIALDSWITMGAASRGFTGIPRSEDTSKFSLIANRPSLKESDGLTKGVLPDFKTFNLNLDGFFNNDSTAKRFSTSNGGWAAPGGVKGPTAENRVLIAQLTTNGKLSFELNVQIGTPTGGYVKFVAKNPEESEIQFNGLTYKQY
jgi:hypothetical protein